MKVLYAVLIALFLLPPEAVPQSSGNSSVPQGAADNGPLAVANTGLVYDSFRHKTVLFGGTLADGAIQNGTWEWDGENWTKIDVAGPSRRHSHAMVFDSRRRRVVLFGGSIGNDVTVGDTWEYDGETWRKVSEEGPSPRAFFGLAYDTRSGKTILYGGSQGYGKAAFKDTWEWDGTSWKQAATSGPSGHYFHKMAYDEKRGRVVSFGGRGGGGETWEWDGKAWTKLSSMGPPPRDHHAIAYHGKRKKVVIFAGSRQAPGGGYPKDPKEKWLNDIWEWNGKTWTRIGDGGISAIGGQPGLTYDHKRRRLVLFGGGNAEGILQGTWEWADEKWQQVK